MQSPMEAIPTANNISSTEESERGASFLNRSWEALVMGFERCSGARRVIIVSGTFSGVWRRIISSMEVFPPYNDRSGDDLSVGGGLGPSRCLERGFRRSWWLGRAWWRGFVDRATIYPMVEVVARLDAWKLEFRGSPCLAELGSSEIAPVHAKTPGNAVPTDGANVGGAKVKTRAKTEAVKTKAAKTREAENTHRELARARERER
uniref:Uncharacterized protein n=1 Tax=Fagus sylvatica TaxID=28930 RepID=A0A2N9ERA8_FAGSY